MDEVIYFHREMVKPMMKQMTPVGQQGIEFVEKIGKIEFSIYGH
jgi:hypothetical protein